MDAVKFLQERNRMYESGSATPGIGLEDDYDPAIAHSPPLMLPRWCMGALLNCVRLDAPSESFPAAAQTVRQ